MVGGMESVARIYDTKIRKNRGAFPNSIKKVKGKDDKKIVFGTETLICLLSTLGGWWGCGWVAFEAGQIKSRMFFLYISDKNGTSKLDKLAIFDHKWNFLNLVANFDK